jgi:hypothetical protein
MALIDTDKNGLGAGSAEVLLGSSLLEQHPTALIDSRYRTRAAARTPNPKNDSVIHDSVFPRQS